MVKPVKKVAAKKRAPAKKMVRRAGGIVAPRATVAGQAPGAPNTWWFPTQDPNIVMECTWNPAEHRYNIGCHPIQLSQTPSHIVAAIKKSR